MWVDTPGLWWSTPDPAYGQSTSGLTLDDTEEFKKVALVFRSPRSAVLAGVSFKLGTVTTGQTLRVGVQDVSISTGHPDGTYDASGTVAVADGDDNAWKTATFGTPLNVVKGQVLAVVIQFDSTAGNLQIEVMPAPVGGTITGYADYFSGTWGKQATSPWLALDWSDGAHVPSPDLFVAQVLGARGVSSTGTPDEIGNRFSLPFDAMCEAAWVMFICNNADQASNIRLYDDADNILGTVVLDHDQVQFPAYRVAAVPFERAILLHRNQSYRVAFAPTTTATHFVPYQQVDSGSRIFAVRNGGGGMGRTQRTDGGSWSDEQTERVAAGVVLMAINDATPVTVSWMPQGRSVGEESPLILPR